MRWQFTFYLVPLIAGAVVTFGLALSGWRRRYVPGAPSFIILMLAVTLWSLAYSLELMSADLQHMLFWASFKYFGIVLVPASWLALSIQYMGRESWLTSRNLFLLAVEPLVVVALVWTNDYHGLFWSHIALKSVGSLNIRAVSYGPWFMFHTLYSYVLMLSGTVFVFQILNREPKLYQGQGIAAFTAILAPWAGNIVHVFRISPFTDLDPTPFTFSVVGLAIIFGFLRFRLLDIVPVARDVVIRSMSDIVVILDANDRVVEINPAAQETLGKTAESSIGQSATEVLSQWPGLLGRFRNVTDAHNEIFIGDGPQERCYDLRISALYGRKDRITGRLLVLRDITDVKRVQKAMQYRLAFENVVMNISANFINVGPIEIDGEINRALRIIGEFADMDRAYVFLFSDDGQFMDNTHEWCRQGIEPQISRLKGLPVEDFPWWMRKIRGLENIHIPSVSDMPPEAAAEKEILQSQEILSLVVLPLAYGGLPIGYLGADSVKVEKVWSEDIINLLKIVGEIFVNALERKRAALILQAAHEELEQRVRERTLELVTINEKLRQEIEERRRTQEEKAILEEQFLQSQKMEAVGKLAGGIAHDFNNLLTVISGYSDISLETMKDGDPLRKNIEEIQKASQRATELTHQLLAFSRRQILDMKVLNLNAVLREIDKMLPRIIGEDIELVTKLAEDLGNVRADPGQIEQVMLNLAVNARDAMPKGGKFIIETANIQLDEAYVNSHIGSVPGPYVMVSLGDTGCGIPPELQERIFEPFFTTKGKGKGTGLGLSTVYGILKQMGGYIWVYSEPGQGTTFKIYLPRVVQESVEVRGRDEFESMPRGTETILLAEDEPLLRGVVVRVLREQGYRILEAANGMEALRILREHPLEGIALLLTDVVMPQMGGKDLADRIRSMSPRIKVLYMSGYTDDAIVDRGILNPGIDFLQKPFTPTALAKKVREVLESH